MFILNIKNNFILLLILFLTSCEVFLPVEPVAKVNDRFKSKYGSDVAKARSKNKEAIKRSPYDGTVSEENTAYGRLMQDRLDFLEKNAENNPYAEVETSGEKNIRYLQTNYGMYEDPNNNIFDDVEIPSNDFKYYNIGQKDYNEVNNIEIQDSYDYIDAINQEKIRQIEISRMREEAENQNKPQIPDMNKNKTNKGVKSLRDRLKDILK